MCIVSRVCVFNLYAVICAFVFNFGLRFHVLVHISIFIFSIFYLFRGITSHQLTLLHNYIGIFSQMKHIHWELIFSRIAIYFCGLRLFGDPRLFPRPTTFYENRILLLLLVLRMSSILGGERGEVREKN